MKKGLIVALVLAMTASVFAFNDSDAPRLNTKKTGAKATTLTSNMYIATSTDFGLTYTTPVNVTNFNYAASGKWVLFNPSQVAIKSDGSPVFSFAGGNDFNGYSYTWFWSAATGVVVVDSGLVFHGWTGMCVADNGDLYVSWGDYYLGAYVGENAYEGDIYISRSTDNGTTWGPAVNVSNYIQALYPSDSCQVYPKIAKRAIDGIHLFYADDSRAPGSNIQGVGADDTLHLRYAKVDLDLGGLDATIGVQDMGTTAYDWACTGNTQGIAMDAAQNIICAWTYGPVGANNGPLRSVRYNYYLPGSGVGMQANLAPRRAGFPGIDVSADGYPMIVYHSTISGASIISGYIDEGGIGYGLWGGIWMFEIIVPASDYIWPSVAFTGPTPSDSIAICGVLNTNYTRTQSFCSPDGGATWDSTICTAPDQVGVYAAIGANHNNVYTVYEADSTIFIPPSPPALNLTVVSFPVADPITLWWLRSSTDATVDSFFLLRKEGGAGNWTQFRVIDTVDWAGQDTVRCFDDWPFPHIPVDTFSYVLLAKDAQGYSDTSNMVWVIIGIVGGINGTPIAVNGGKLSLNQNRPNPVKGNTEIAFNLPKAGNYSLEIFNITGQIIRSLDGKGDAGLNKVSWNGTDNNGRKVSSGVYLYALKAQGNSATKKLVVVK